MKRNCFIICFLVFIMFSVNLYAIMNNNLEIIYEFANNESGFASLDSRTGRLMVSTYFYNYNEIRQSISWYENGKIIKYIKDARNGKFSPDGRYYSYIKNDSIMIFDENDRFVIDFPIQINSDNMFESYKWSYDAKYVYLCEIGRENVIYRYEIETGKKEVILKENNIYFHPVPVKDNNIVYVLKNNDPDGPAYDCSIAKVDIRTKEITDITLPLKNYFLYDVFTVSPDGRFLIFQNDDGYIYILDIENQKIVDKIKALKNTHANMFNWEIDGKYVIFTMTSKEMFKYSFE